MAGGMPEKQQEYDNDGRRRLWRGEEDKIVVGFCV